MVSQIRSKERKPAEGRMGRNKIGRLFILAGECKSNTMRFK